MKIASHEIANKRRANANKNRRNNVGAYPVA